MLPMLATATKPSEIRTSDFMSDLHVWQVKIDGDRRIAGTDGTGGVFGFNRDGAPATVPHEAARELAAFTMRLVLDAELLNGVLVVFDLIELGAEGILPLPLDDRLLMLEALFAGWVPAGMVLCPTARSLEEKEHMIRQVADRDGEGWIVKRLDSRWAEPTRPGQRSKDWRKIKRTHDVDCVVEWVGTDPSGKDNMGLTMYHDGELIDGGYARDGGRRGGVAECTRRAGSGYRIQPGDVVKVQCLYASEPTEANPHGRLVQPTLPRLRDDKPADQCTVDQLDTIRTYKRLPLDWQPLPEGAPLASVS